MLQQECAQFHSLPPFSHFPKMKLDMSRCNRLLTVEGFIVLLKVSLDLVLVLIASSAFYPFFMSNIPGLPKLSFISSHTFSFYRANH